MNKSISKNIQIEENVPPVTAVSMLSGTSGVTTVFTNFCLIITASKFCKIADLFYHDLRCGTLIELLLSIFSIQSNIYL